MKRASIGALLVSLAVGSAAWAGQGYRGNTDHREVPRDVPNAHQQPVRDFHGRDDHRDRRFDNGRRDNRYGHDNYYRPVPSAPRYVYRPAPRYAMYQPPRGYYARTWRHGDRLPTAYYARPYVIADYRDCGLRAPPRGYHWVRVNHDAVLAAVATGVVLESVFHLF